MRSDRVARLLVERGRIGRRELAEAVRARGFFGGELESHLLKLGHVSEADLGAALSEHHGLPYASAEQLRAIPRDALEALPRNLIERFRVCPFERDGGTLRVAMLDPTDRLALAEIEREARCAVERWVTCEYRLYSALERHWRIRPDGVRAIALAPPDPRIVERGSPARGSSEVAIGEARRGDEVGLDGLPIDQDPEVQDTSHGDWTRSPQVRDWLEERPPGANGELIFSATRATAPPRTTRELGEALADARDRAAIADSVLEYALGRARRAALFAAGKDRIRGFAGAGRGFEDVRRVAVAPGSGTVFDLVGASGDSYVGPVPPLPANRDLYTALGGSLPREVMIVPVSVTGRVSAYLYLDGDDASIDRPDLPALRRVAAMTGLAFELLLLRNKLREG